MDHIKIGNISEEDFDRLIVDAGGNRIEAEGNADYVLNEALIELKLVTEEGFGKETRRSKLAQIFKKYAPKAPVIPILPSKLNPEDLQSYHNAIEGPIKSHVKKAASQLKKTAEARALNEVRVLVILNVGYTAISIEEFKTLCIRRAQNDTTRIDWLICGGIYTYSDTFDFYALAPFEAIQVNIGFPFPSQSKLQNGWNKYVEELLTKVIKEGLPSDGKLPVLDLVFEVDGITYVKPSPKFPKSSFWPDGERPRDNSTGIDACPPVGLIYPHFTEEDWRYLRHTIPCESRLEKSYLNWRQAIAEKEEEGSALRPFVAIFISRTVIDVAVGAAEPAQQFDVLVQAAVREFGEIVRGLVSSSRAMADSLIQVTEYMRLDVHEIGQDEVNDLCTLYYVSNLPGFEREEVIFETQRLFFDYGIRVASAYAVKRQVKHVFYQKIRVFDT